MPRNPDLQGATLTVAGGKASGRVLYIVAFVGDTVAVSGAGNNLLDGIAAGDEVLIDNSNHLAYQTYHRHQVDADYPEWDEFFLAGTPVYPQRPALLGPRMNREVTG